jgi:hypothetical protein
MTAQSGSCRLTSIQRFACYGLTSILHQRWSRKTALYSAHNCRPDERKTTKLPGVCLCLTASENICCSAWVSRASTISHWWPPTKHGHNEQLTTSSDIESGHATPTILGLAASCMVCTSCGTVFLGRCQQREAKIPSCDLAAG